MTKGKNNHHQNLELPHPVVGWVYNHAIKNYWRVAKWYEVDDLIHDGLMCAYKCRERYGTELDQPHFMRLVQKAFRNHIGDMLRRRTHTREIKIADIAPTQTEEFILDRIQKGDCGFGQEVASIIHDLPDKLRRAVFSRRERFGAPTDEELEVAVRAFIWEREFGIV